MKINYIAAVLAAILALGAMYTPSSAQTTRPTTIQAVDVTKATPKPEREIHAAFMAHEVYRAHVARWRRFAAMNTITLLREARAIVKATKALLAQPIGFPASCVAMAEEGGHNSAAGYFGTIYPPSSYPEPGPTVAAQYGDSWLAIPYAAQLNVALGIFGAYGASAWGPLTREKCFV